MTGYYVGMNLCYNGVPVLWDAMRLRVQGNEIAYVSVRRHKPVENGATGQGVRVVNAINALETVSNLFKNDLGITEKYEVVDCTLYYADLDHLQFGRMTGLDGARRFVPVWRYAVRYMDATARRTTSYVFVDALTSRYLEAIK